ncbi:MAG TPA: hypothetical protein DCE17_05445 [Lactobacillus sp.]|nr:hypothetical protein [Lactobacillus sp.]HAP23626.1 hypothetical protein [Lactobacillus sp.]
MIATDFISKYRIDSGSDLPLKFEKVVEEGIILDVIDVSKVIKAKRARRIQAGIDIKRIFGNLAITQRFLDRLEKNGKFKK